MAGIGYYGGLYEGLEKLTNVQNRQVDTQSDMIRAGAMRDQNMREQAKFAVEQRQKLLLNNALMGTAAEESQKGEVQGMDTQIQNLTKLGNKILGIDPKLGLQFLNQAGDLTAQRATAAYNGMRLEAAKGDYLSNVAWGIKDQSSLDEGVEQLSKAGVVVPPQYQVWSPETERYFRLKGQLSKNRANTMKAEAVAQNAETKANAEGRIAQNQERTLAQKDKEQARKQANYKAPTEAERGEEVTILNEYEGFDDLPKGKQQQAAREVYDRAYALRLEGMDAQSAMEQAREDIIAKYTEKSSETSGLPKIGAVIGGYKFKGGNPNDKANWEKQ